jgi:hypothetical protein
MPQQQEQQAMEQDVAGRIVPPNTHRPPPQMSILQSILIQLEYFAQHGMYIPRSPGIIYDVIALVTGLVCSLFPGWNAYQPPPNYLPNHNNNNLNNQPPIGGEPRGEEDQNVGVVM